MATNSRNKSDQPRTISRQKGVEICTELMFAGQKPGDIVRKCQDEYGVSRSAVEKWMKLARPGVELRKKEVDEMRKKETEKAVVVSTRETLHTRERFEARLWDIYEANIQDFYRGNNNLIPVTQLPREKAALISAIEIDELYHGSGDHRYWAGQTKKLKLIDPLRAGDMIAKLNGWYKDEGGPKTNVNVFIGYGKEAPV